MDQFVSKNIQWEKINVWCCDAFFPYGNIKQHQEEAHSDNVKPMKLSFICGKSFSRQGAARIHERIHKSQFTCNFCKTGFRQKSFLKKHRKVCQSSATTDRIGRERTAKKTKEAAIYDTNEDSDTVEISVIPDAKTIVKKVVEVNAIKKNVNGDAFVVLEHNAVNKEKINCSEDETDNDVKLRENPKEGKGMINDKDICIICGAAIASPEMSKHVKRVHTMKDIKNFSCKYCGKSFKYKKSMKECENRHSGVFIHSCHLCKYKTNNKWNLNRHVNTHLNIKPVNKDKIKCSEDETDDDVKLLENPKEGKGKINDKDICIICGAAIASPEMSKHVKRVHTMKDIKNFSCKYCGKSFKYKKSMKECEYKHNGVFIYSCHSCEYKTNNKWTLNRHVNTHLNIKPYSCPACQFKSGTKADVRRHVRTQHETDGSIISQLEASYPHMYNASKSDDGLRNDPLFQKLVPAKRKSKWKYQPTTLTTSLIKHGLTSYEYSVTEVY